MSIQSFEETMDKLNKELMRTKSHDFNDKFMNLHKIAIKSYPQEFYTLMKEIGFAKEIIILQSNASEFLSLIDSYHINDQKKTISVRKGNLVLEEPLCDLTQMINEKFKNKNSWEWNLLGSYFSDINNYSIMQITKSIILQENK